MSNYQGVVTLRTALVGHDVTCQNQAPFGVQGVPYCSTQTLEAEPSVQVAEQSRTLHTELGALAKVRV